MGDPLACKWCKRKTQNGKPALPMDFDGIHVGVGHRPCFEAGILDVLEDSIRATVVDEYDGKIILDSTAIEEGDSFTYKGATWYLTQIGPIKKEG